MTQSLSLAVAYNDESIVKMFINDSNVDVNQRTPPLGRTMLHLAVRNDNVNIARLLIEKGANVDASSDDNLTAMHIAVANRSRSMIELLIKHKASVNPKVKFNGKTPLYMAVEHDCQEIVEILLRNGSCIEDATILNTTVIHVALRINAFRLSMLLAKCASPEILDIKDNLEGKTVLHMAIERKNRELAKLLLQKGANAEMAYNTSTPLSMALARKDVIMAALLLRYGASKSTDECLRYAMKNRCRDIAASLLDTGAVDVNNVSKDGSSALYAAVLSGHFDMVRLCLDNGADLGTLGPDKVPILYYAIKKGNAEVVQLLLDRGALSHDIVYRGHKYNLLDVAARCRDVCVCKMLLRRGISVNPSCPKAELAFAVKCIALLQATEADTISENNLKLLVGHKLWNRFHDKCLTEIDQLKKEVLVGSISFFDLLTKGENELAAYARNKDFLIEFPKSNYRSRFAIYGEILALNYTKARVRNSLLQKAVEDFGRLQEFSLTSVCAQKIVSQLSNDDLRSFIKGVCECKLDLHICLPQLIISL